MPDPSALLAAAFVAGVRADGLDPDPELRLVRSAPAALPAARAVTGPNELGPRHESLLDAAERTRRGAWYTPPTLAEELVALAVPDPAAAQLVVDPACGGGVFLLAAADRLSLHRSPGETIDSLWGCDLDPLAVAVTEAALWWWSARLGDPTVPTGLVVGDALDREWPTADAVVGNPPFLGQLRRATTTDPARRARLHARFGDVLRPYTDEAWLFLRRAVDCVGPGGRVVLLQPRSVLAARDAGPIRDAVDADATVVDTWLAPDGAFAAAVDTCAPVIERTGAARNDWTATLGDVLGVPGVDLPSGSIVGDRAAVVAGFRDEYYGLVGHVREGGTGPRLVTSGSIDPLQVRNDPVRFAKRTWDDPRVERAGLDGRARSWVDQQLHPKVVVATQTRVLEVVADPDGTLVAGVPAIVVRPHDPDDLWRLAAALGAPAVSALIVRATAGTGLGTDSCRPTASLLSGIPLPIDLTGWDRAADLARRLADGHGSWAEFGRVADAAYGVDDPSTLDWWLARLPVRSPAA